MRDMNIEIKVIKKATCSICGCEGEVKRSVRDWMCDRCTWFWYKEYKGKPQSDSLAWVEVAKKTKPGLLKPH